MFVAIGPAQSRGDASVWPHRLAVVLACATFPLLFIGGLVPRKGAGLAVPDWPRRLCSPHVPLPMVQNGRQYFLRAQPSFGGVSRWVADYRVDLGILAPGAPSLAALAWSRGAVVGDSPGCDWRPAGRFA